MQQLESMLSSQDNSVGMLSATIMTTASRQTRQLPPLSNCQEQRHGRCKYGDITGCGRLWCAVMRMMAKEEAAAHITAEGRRGQG